MLPLKKFFIFVTFGPTLVEVKLTAFNAFSSCPPPPLLGLAPAWEGGKYIQDRVEGGGGGGGGRRRGGDGLGGFGGRCCLSSFPAAAAASSLPLSSTSSSSIVEWSGRGRESPIQTWSPSSASSAKWPLQARGALRFFLWLLRALQIVMGLTSLPASLIRVASRQQQWGGQGEFVFIPLEAEAVLGGRVAAAAASVSSAAMMATYGYCSCAGESVVPNLRPQAGGRKERESTQRTPQEV